MSQNAETAESDQITPVESGRLLVAHSNLEFDAHRAAVLYHHSHKPDAYAINRTCVPSQIFDAEYIQLHGEEFCQLVIHYIVDRTLDEVKNYAIQATEKLRANLVELVDIIFYKSPSEAFNSQDLITFGENFMIQVQGFMSYAFQSMQRAQAEAKQQNAAEKHQATIKSSHHHGLHSAPLSLQQTMTFSGIFSRIRSIKRHSTLLI